MLWHSSPSPSLQRGDNTKGLSYTILGPSIAVAEDTSYSFFIHEHTKIIQMKIIKIQIERKTKHFLPLLFAVGGVGGVTPPSPLSLRLTRGIKINILFYTLARRAPDARYTQRSNSNSVEEVAK